MRRDETEGNARGRRVVLAFIFQPYSSRSRALSYPHPVQTRPAQVRSGNTNLGSHWRIEAPQYPLPPVSPRPLPSQLQSRDLDIISPGLRASRYQDPDIGDCGLKRAKQGSGS